MSQTTAILAELKRALRAAGLTYADLASHLELSEASVKRLFHTEGFSLQRLEQACALIGIEVADLVTRANANERRVSELTPEQELELLGNPKLLLMSYMLLNQWRFDEIIDTFTIERAEGRKLLRQLEQLSMIEILPFDRVKLLTARNFSWRRNGPVQKFFRETVQSDFFASGFDAPGATLHLLGARLSPASLAKLEKSIDTVVRQFDDLARQDARIPPEEGASCGAVLAMRPWEFSLFGKLRREPRPDDPQP